VEYRSILHFSQFDAACDACSILSARFQKPIHAELKSLAKLQVPDAGVVYLNSVKTAIKPKRCEALNARIKVLTGKVSDLASLNLPILALAAQGHVTRKGKSWVCRWR
jgi:hypothetical protein